MTPIEEAYVSFEVAKLLEEKGFNQETYAKYATEVVIEKWYDDYRERVVSFEIPEGELIEPSIGTEKYALDGNVISAPTQQMVMRWLREVHNIDIDIHSECGMLGIKVYVPVIHTYKRKEKLHDTDEKVRWSQKTIYLRYEDDDKNVIQAVADFATFEKACDAAIEYCLKNLIK